VDSAPAGATSAPSAGAAGAAATPTPDLYPDAPPVAGGLAQPGVLAPGTVQADFNPRVYAQTWQAIAADPWAPPEAQNFAAMWQTAAGG
jgi:hypothetical protein